MSHDAARTVMFLTLAFNATGAFPRLLGISVAKPEFITFLTILDTTTITLFIVSLVWMFIASKRDKVEHKP